MRQVWSKWIRFAGDLIDHDKAAEGPPPHSLRPFIRWALSGA